MGLQTIPSADTFASVSSGSVFQLSRLPSEQKSFILPTLVRSTFWDAVCDSKETNHRKRNKLKRIIKNFDQVNFLYEVSNIDFSEFKDDILKSNQLKQKLAKIGASDKSGLPSQISGNSYEKSSPVTKMRMILTELLRIISVTSNKGNGFCIDDGELFQCEIFVEEVSDALCMAYSELPTLLPITDVTEALLCVKHGPWMINKLVVNNPECFEEVCSSIIKNTTMSDEFSLDTQIRMATLSMLCKLNPAYRKSLRSECVSNCKLAGLAIQLSINEDEEGDVSDIVPYFLGILLASDTRTRDWIADFIKASQKDHKENALTLFKRQLVKEMNIVIETLLSFQDHAMEIDDDDSSLLMNKHLMRGISIMKLFCSLKTLTGFKLLPAECDILLSLITAPVIHSQLGVRYITVAICTVVASSFLLSSEREVKLKEWLISLTGLSSKENDPSCSFGEVLLLIAIHFHNSKLEAVVELICSTLGIKVKTGSLAKMKILFTQEIFPEKVVAAHAVTVKVTNGLNKNITQGFLPAHCILQLMRTRIFTKHDVSVQEWLLKQLRACTIPIHPIVLQLIDAFVQSVVVTVNVSKAKLPRLKALQPFAEDEIAAAFLVTNDIEKKDYVDVTTTKILFMFYLLKFQDALFSNMKTLVNNPKAPRQYSTHLYSMIPMKRLLLKTRSDEHSFGDLYPSLLKLLTTYYPHLCLVEDWIAEEEIEENSSRTASDVPSKLIVEGPTSKSFDNLMSLSQCPQKFMLKFSKLLLLSPEKLSDYEDLIVALLPKLLEVDVPKKMQMLLYQAWIKVNTVTPNSIWYKTVNILQVGNSLTEMSRSMIKFSDEEIQKDPLVVLRCDPRVYRVPLVFDIVLRVLNGYLTASKSAMNHHLMSNPIILGTRSNQEISFAEQEREELKTALIAAQESAAIQILLEVCLPTDEERKNQCYATQSILREIQCKCCCYFHQSFIKNPSMAKLIHFQGYPPELLSVTVPGIPSIHICLDFIPELLNQTHLEKQLFAVQLTSHIAVQFPIPKSYSISQYVMNRLNNLLMALPSLKRNQFFVPALRCALQICRAFPPLRKEATDLFIKVGKIATSQLDKTTLTAVTPLNKKTSISIDDADVAMDTDDDFSQTTPDIKTNANSLVGDNPAYNRCLELKTYSCEELRNESENAFKALSKMSLSDKYVNT